MTEPQVPSGCTCNAGYSGTIKALCCIMLEFMLH